MNNIIPSPKVRAWVYGVLIAAAPLAVFYGLATEEEVALWLGVAAAALGNGLALANVPGKNVTVVPNPSPEDEAAFAAGETRRVQE